MPYHKRPRGLLALVGLLAVATAASSAHAAAAASTPYLPAPTGAHPVGTTSLHLTDKSRPDPWVPAAGARELMVSLWFPAKSRGERPARYMTPKESELLLRSADITSVPPDVLSRTRVNAYTDVKPLGGKRPLVVLSPGMGWLRTSLTSLAEELASSGYLVAAIDHTYETHATTFPDGRVTTCATCELGIEDFPRLAVESRARDVSFVLDELTRSPMVDASRIAMAGMSLGGASVGETMLTDPRVRAGINLDGTNFKPLPATGLSRPFMFFGAPAAEPSWVRDYQRLTGWKRWFAVQGSVHTSFTDYDMLTNQIGVDLGSKLPGTRSAVITRAYVEAFFDLHLRGTPQPLLERPSTHFPEVRSCTPETQPCQ
ncbi:alpha/beta hydrolase [Crossiella sp. CA-258035]|uniref:alpha/beta hydrolase family protein n=1 Tax=Crossiella sp. CA-258035 TaxID=2981138 RepID=UPI0024BCA200|nr:alpha/beta hydrolase [Crossiella sp. CA-258035]WHT23309.1 alpha/beta hydrolase [Crossiella sp. CA-258035]